MVGTYLIFFFRNTSTPKILLHSLSLFAFAKVHIGSMLDLLADANNELYDDTVQGVLTYIPIYLTHSEKSLDLNPRI
jgi:hypothetical protein